MTALTTHPRAAESHSAVRVWPAPRGHWLWGHLREVQRTPLTLYDRLRAEHGDYVRLRFPLGLQAFLLGHPAAIEHVLVKNARNYRKPDMFNRSAQLVTGAGILVSEGELWRRQRRLMQPAFARQQVTRFGANMETATRGLIERWTAERAQSAEPLDVAQEMVRLTMGIVSSWLFSSQIAAEADEVGQAIRETFALVGARLNGEFRAPLWVPTPGNRRFLRSRQLLWETMSRLIAARRAAGTDQRDLLGMLLAAQDEESGRGMTDEQVRDEVITLLIAGHDTVGAALSWAWYLLGKHPQVQEDLHDEAAGVLQGRIPTVADLERLPLATAIFEETLRLYPPAWGQPREALVEDSLQGYPIPARAPLIISQWLAHRHPDFWSEPLRFHPDRFLGAGQGGSGPAGDTSARPRFAYFPFGGGPRICIGKEFALLEGPLILAALAQQFRLEEVPGQIIEPDATFTLRPAQPVRMHVTLR
ncbi:MAG: cytochrome P450 [Pirellulales bacterium]